MRETIARGDIGEVVSVQADHGQQLTHIERLMNPELAGGALLDLGVYPIAFAHDVLGVPDSVTAVGQMTDSGVDGQVGMVFDYGQRAQATLTTTLWATTPCTAAVAGTEGHIQLETMFYTPTRMKVTRKDGTSWDFDGRVPNGFQYEAAELARNVAAGLTESPSLPWAQTLEIMGLMDGIREQIGLRYPGE
jgi:predicted dehydrogenase